MGQQKSIDGLSLIERSEFFRGLLLIMAADGELHAAERELIREAILPFDFSSEYVEECIESILKNPHVNPAPPKFHNQTNSLLFLEKAIEIAFADGVLDELEERWLRATAELNNIPAEWLEAKIASND